MPQERLVVPGEEGHRDMRRVEGKAVLVVKVKAESLSSYQ